MSSFRIIFIRTVSFTVSAYGRRFNGESSSKSCFFGFGISFLQIFLTRSSQTIFKMVAGDTSRLFATVWRLGGFNFMVQRPTFLDMSEFRFLSVCFRGGILNSIGLTYLFFLLEWITRQIIFLMTFTPLAFYVKIVFSGPCNPWKRKCRHFHFR